MPPAQRINEANDEAEKLRKENEELRAKVATLAALNKGKKMSNEVDIEDQGEDVETVTYEATEYKGLQEIAKERGINPNQKKAQMPRK